MPNPDDRSSGRPVASNNSDREPDSIFRTYYANVQFDDRFQREPERGVDVMIPVIHTNELWKANLFSFYREIPIHKLFIGDGGCIDNSIDVVKEFPRVEVLDHRSYKSLGYSLRELIKAVETDWFIYVHSDVYLPPGWFDTMQRHQSEFDWFGCPMKHTVMVQYEIPEKVRPYAGSQMGRKSAFAPGLDSIDDDYVYRQEDFVLADLVEKAGFRHGKIEDTFHYHQTTYKPSAWVRTVTEVNIEVYISPEEEVRTRIMHSKGIIKYLQPTNPALVKEASVSIDRLFELGELTPANWPDFKRWVAETNANWLPYLPQQRPWRKRLRTMARNLFNLFFD
jgi:glycosyl transferase family 2